MDADAKLDAALGGDAGIALDHTILNLKGAAHGINDAAELDERPVAGSLHHAPVMHRDDWVDQIAPQSPQPRQRAILIGAREAAITHYIGGENCHDLATCLIARH